MQRISPKLTAWKNVCEQLRSLVFEILENRKKEERIGESRDFLDSLLEEKDPNTNQSYTKEEIFGDVADILLAG